MSSSRTGARIDALKPTIQPPLLRAFYVTGYGAGGVTARIGQRDPGVDRLLCALGSRRGAFLTAWNPAARRHPLGRNLRWDLALRGWLRRVRAEPGFGSARGWREAHWLVAADPRRVAVLGRRFRQVGIVVVQRGGKARLLLLSAGADVRPAGLTPLSPLQAARQPARSTVSRPRQPGAPRDRCFRPGGPT